MIDLRSDTVTRPTAGMRRAMAEAEVGDDVYGDDPSVAALERRVAEVLGKGAAVYMPSGTMSNQVALRAHTEAGDEVLMEQSAHLYLYECGAPAGLSGLMMRRLPGRHGVFSAEDVQAAMPPPHPSAPSTLSPPTKLLCVENTHNVAGGTVWPLEAVQSVTTAARQHGLATHLDGARLWHATVATGIPEAEYASAFDTVSVCFSKGLGAPVGSALVGSAELMTRARRFRAMFGGACRQSGIVAAGALYALEHHRARLIEDHRKARELADGLAATPGVVIDTASVQTNIVRFRLTSCPAAEFLDRCLADGLLMLPGEANGARAVMHLDVSEAQVEQTLAIIRRAVAPAADGPGATRSASTVAQGETSRG